MELAPAWTHDPMNDDISNLERVTRSEHARIHAKERANGASP